MGCPDDGSFDGLPSPAQERAEERRELWLGLKWGLLFMCAIGGLCALMLQLLLWLMRVVSP